MSSDQRVALLIRGISLVCKLGVIAWGTLAAYWSAIPDYPMRVLLAGAFMTVSAISLLFYSSRFGWKLISVGAAIASLSWLMEAPSNFRDWRPEVSVLPRAKVEGDRVFLSGVRNFDYRSERDFTPHYEDRQVDLSKIQSVDLFVSQGGNPCEEHSLVSFSFEGAFPICISIEARLEKGEEYSLLASCFKEAELIYVVGDERDLLGVRTHFRSEEMRLYQTGIKPEQARLLFLSCLDKINSLVNQPEYYHPLVPDSVARMTEIIRPEDRSGFLDVDGLLEKDPGERAYESGLLASSISFPELHKQAVISRIAIGGNIRQDFSRRIRAHLH